MEISADTKEILEFLDYTTANNLRKRNDIASIMEIGATYGESDIMNDLILASSSLWNINQTLIRSQTQEISIENLYKEKQTNTIKMIDLLKELIGNEYNEVTERFNKIYFAETAGAERNLIDLAHDLNELNKLRKTIKSTKNQL